MALEQVGQVWNALTPRRKIVAVGSALAVFALILLLARIAAAPRFEVLYAQLDERAAGEVVRALEQRNIPFQVRGGAIYVDAAQRDSLRLTLAAEGLPANSTQGYELLDSLQGFGTTAQMFDAAYWRAKEGELARTMLASPGITAARVHIAQTDGNPFRRDQRPTASVVLTSARGEVDPDTARAMRYLVAAAVPGMLPGDVSIIDGLGRLVTSDDTPTSAVESEDRALAIKERVQRLVEARVGPGNAVVEVGLETVRQSESILERRLDPEGRVAISTDTEERTNTSTDAAAAVTVASNLPDGDAAGAGENRSQNSEARERVNYEVSETTREITRGPGDIKRLTVAVLVNGTQVAAEDGTTQFQPLPQPELDDLRELVAAAIALDEARGDQITIRSMPFEQRSIAGTAATRTAWYQQDLDMMQLIQITIAALVTLVVALFVLRPILMPRQSAQDPLLPAPADPPAEEVPTQAPALATIAPSEALSETDDMPLMVSDSSAFDAAFGDALGESSDPVDRLRALIDARKEETVEVLRNWLDEREAQK